MITVNADEIEIPFIDGSLARSGSAFITRAENGEKWSGTNRELRHVAKPDDITRLVIFDTWVQNRDRHREDHSKPDNVFLSVEGPPGKLTLVVSDHTHCFGVKGQITQAARNISRQRDDQVYGLFPAFRPYLDRNVAMLAVRRLGQFSRELAERFVGSIPREWDVAPDARAALADLLIARAQYLRESIIGWLWPQRELDFMAEVGDE